MLRDLITSVKKKVGTFIITRYRELSYHNLNIDWAHRNLSTEWYNRSKLQSIVQFYLFKQFGARQDQDLLFSYHSIHPKCSASLQPGLLTDLRMSPTFPIFAFAHVLSSPCRVVLHLIPNLTLWIWSPEAILITCAHLPLRNWMWSLNSKCPRAREEGRGQGAREEWTEVSYSIS